MSISLPSKRVSVVDVPEVDSFRASFVYNFFVPDESLNDSGDVPDDVKKLPAESFDSERINSVRRVVPRFVRFDFSRVMLHQGSITGNEFTQHPNPSGKSNDFSIAQNLAHIQSESEFSSQDYIGFEFQDDNVDRKLFTIVSGSVAKRVTAKNRNVQNQIDEDRQTVLDRLSSEHSLLDAAKALTSDSTTGVSDNMIVNALNQIDALKLTLVDDAGQKQIVNDTFARVRSVSVRGQVSNRLVGRIVTNIVNDPMSTYADEFASSQKYAKTIQQQALSRSRPSVIDKSEFEPTFHAIDRKPVDAHDHVSTTRILGYIIEKYEVTSDGKLKSHPPIILENSDIGTAIDTHVAYGRTYLYTIRTVAQINVRASIEDSDDVVMGIGLVSSRRSSKVTVTCTESVPPPAPSDFNVIWDYTNDAPILSWAFPPNIQRDVKKFQVFRRFSINEPFQLIRQYDFDDSQIKAQLTELPDPALVDKLSDPLTLYQDREFQKSWVAIYAVCSIDAHGFSSNYSLQLEISFDRSKNRMRKRIISFSGAPKSYPNMSLNTDLFVDTIRTSGHTRLKVYFDPEYLKVLDTRGNDLRLITRANVDGGAYRLQLINTDILEQEVIDLTINDMRPTSDR